jgi:hypothetical protein
MKPDILRYPAPIELTPTEKRALSYFTCGEFENGEALRQFLSVEDKTAEEASLILGTPLT